MRGAVEGESVQSGAAELGGMKPTSREALQLVNAALRLSAHVISSDPQQLRGQLVGRLSGTKLEEIRQLVDDIAGLAERPWLRPLSPTLTGPRSPLRWIFRGDFYEVAITPDGSQALAAAENIVRVIDLRSGRELSPLLGHRREVDWVSVAPDGSRVAASDFENEIRVWDLGQGAETQSLSEPTVSRMVLSRDGRIGVAARTGDEGGIVVCDLESGTVVKTVESNGLPCCLSGNGNHLVAADDDGLRVLDLRDGLEIRSVEVEGRVGAVSWDAMIALTINKRTKYGAADHSISVWDLESGECIGVMKGHGERIRSLAVTPDGRTAASASDDGSVRVWDVTSHTTTAVLRHSAGVWAAWGTAERRSGVKFVAMSADGRTILSLADDLRVWALPETRQVRVLKGHDGQVKELDISPDGSKAVTAASDSSVRVWDLETGQTTLVVRFKRSQCSSVTFLRDGSGVLSYWHKDFAADFEDFPSDEEDSDYIRGIVLIDPEEKKAHVLSSEDLIIGSIIVAPDGSWAMSGRDARYAWRLLGDWKLEVLADEEEWERQVLANIEPIGNVTFMPDGCRALSTNYCSEDYQVPMITLWDLENDETVRSYEGHSKNIEDVAVTPAGDRFLSASRDETVRLWDIESGEELRVLRGHSDTVNSVSASPDGGRVITGSADGTLIVWDLSGGEVERVLEGHTGDVNALAVTPDGQSVVSVSNDQTVRVWDLESDQGGTGWERYLGPVTGVAVASRAPKAISVMGRQVTLWDLNTRSILKQHDYPWASMGGSVVLGSNGDTALTIKLPTRDSTSGLLEWSLGEEATIESSIEEIVCHAGPSHDFGIRAVATTPELDLALCGCEDHTVRLWRMQRGGWIHYAESGVTGRHAKGEEIWCLEGHSKEVLYVAITPDGCRGISASHDHTLRLWDLESGTELCVLEGHTAQVTAVAISEDGQLAISGASDCTIKVWDVSRPPSRERPDLGSLCVRTVQLHEDAVSAVALTSDVRYGVSAAWDNTVRVWDVRTGELIASLTAEARVLDCAVFLDGRTIVAGDETGHVHFLDLCGGP
jgi:WD40 repeat protein